MRLSNPVEFQCQCIGFLIKRSRCQGEIFILDIEFAVINHQIIIEINGCSDFRQNADTLCKLEQEVPCRSIRHICAGKHINEIRKLCRNRDLRHIDGEDIGSRHFFISINCCICDIIKCCRIENITKPCKLAVAARCQAEVKCILALLKHIKRNRAGYTFINCQASSNIDYFNTGSFIANEYIIVDSTGLGIIKSKLQVRHTEGNRLVVIACGNGKNCICTVNRVHMRSGEVYVLGNNNGHFRSADDFTVKHHIDFDTTVFQAGKYTVCRNGSEIIVGYSPSITLGKIRFVACKADTLTGHLNGSTNGSILVITFDHCMIKFSRAGSRRNHHERSSYGTGEAVGRLVYNAELVIAGLSCNEGRRTTTVKVNCLNATCVEHDLRNFFHITAAGEGFLTAIENHEYDLTGLGNTNRSSGCTAGVFRRNDLTVLDKGSTESGNTFCNLILVDLVILLGRSDNGSTVLKNTKESAGVNTMIFLTIHDEKTAGLTGRHIEAVSVDTCNDVIVRNIMRAFGIAVFILSGIRLIKNSGHLPTERRIVMRIVCINMNVASGDITGCDVVNHLFSVSRSCIMNILRDTGSKLNGSRGKYAVIGIFRAFNIVACKLADIICKSVTNGTAKHNKITCVGKISGTLKGSDEFIGKIFRINGISYLCARTVGIQSVGHKVSRAVFIREIFRHIV